MVYVDELSLQHSSQVELAPAEDNKPPLKLKIKFSHGRYTLPANESIF